MSWRVRRRSRPRTASSVDPLARRHRPAASSSWSSHPTSAAQRVRLGFLWFFLALAAVTSGRWWTAALAAVVAAAAGYQTARAWAMARAAAEAESSEPVPVGTGRVPALLAALLAAVVPIGAGYGTGTAGAALLLVAAVSGLLIVTVGRVTGSTVAIAAVLPALGASSIVLALQVDLWAALFLVLAVSLFDAGNFLLGVRCGRALGGTGRRSARRPGGHVHDVDDQGAAAGPCAVVGRRRSSSPPPARWANG